MDLVGKAGLRNFRRELRSSQQRLADTLDTTAQQSTVVGRFPVNNAGEAYKSINFEPVVFSDQPTMTFGFEIDGSRNVKPTRAPVITASLYEWKIIERNPSPPLYYGAKLLIVSTGPSLVKFTVTWNAVGIAFGNPRS